MNMFTRKRVPASIVLDQVTDVFKIVGMYSNTILSANDGISLKSISKTSVGNQVISKIPAGYRAVTITLSRTKSIEGWLQAGTSVDVYWIYAKDKKPVIVPIVFNAKVISADRQTEEQRHNIEKSGEQVAVPTAASLLVLNEDALKIQLASNNGELTLSLRGDDELTNSKSASISLSVNDLIKKGQSLKKVKKDTIKIKNKNGKFEKYYFEDDKLVPLA